MMNVQEVDHLRSKQSVRGVERSTISPSEGAPTTGAKKTEMTTTSFTKTIDVVAVGPVELIVDERGDGDPYLVLHGGAGPQSVSEFPVSMLTTS